MMHIGSWKRAACALAGAVALGGPVAGLAAVNAPSAAGALTNHSLITSTASVGFPATTLGDDTEEQYTVTNNSGSPQELTYFDRSGPDVNDFTEFPDGLDCPDFNTNTGKVELQNGDSCVFDVLFFPNVLDFHQATLTLTDNGSEVSGTTITTSGTGTIGYYQVASDGSLGIAGDAADYGDLSGLPLNSPVVGIAPTGNDGGYWMAAADGGVFNFGPGAPFHGSAGALHLNKPVVGITAPPAESGLNGYWLVATDGGIFSYGDTQFYGSTGAMRLNKPIVGMAATNDGGGYWLVASDGGIFAYGNAQFYGSTGAIHLNQPIVGMAATPDDQGYWLVAADGGIFAYGDAPFYGSTGALHLAQPISSMAAMPSGTGYWFSATDGGLFNYGTAPFLGAGNSVGLSDVIGMATDGEATIQAQSGGVLPFARSASNDPGWHSPLPAGARELTH